METNRNRECGRYFFPKELRTLLGWRPLEKEPVRYELSAKQYERVVFGDSALQRTAEKLAAAFRSPVVFVYQDRLCNWADPPAEVATEQPTPVMKASPAEVKKTKESGIRPKFSGPPTMPTVRLTDALTGRWLRRDRAG